MTAEVLPTLSEADRSKAVTRAVKALSEGNLVILPTETVYGVAARADSPMAMGRLREVKARDKTKAFTLHVPSRESVERYVERVPPLARRFTHKIWPGPLTLILPSPDPTSAPIMREVDASTAEALYYEQSIGMRCPDHLVALALLRAAGFPVVAASANRASRTPPNTLDEAMAEIGDDVAVALDGGRTKYSKPSTIIRIREQGYELVREGAFDARTIRRLSLCRLLFVCTGNTCRSPMAEGLARLLLAERMGCRPTDLEDRGVFVSSAGTSGGFGRAADHALAVMRRRGIDMSGHSSSAVSADVIRQADHIYAMTRAHRDTLLGMVPQCADSVSLVIDNDDVLDPIGGTLEEYEQCARVIEEGLRKKLLEVDL